MRKKNINKDPDVDIPMLMLIGAALGFLCTGVVDSTIGAFCDTTAGNPIWSWRTILAGVCCIAISSIIGGVAMLYWKLIVAKRGALFPSLMGFGLLFAVMALLSALIVSAHLSYDLSH